MSPETCRSVPGRFILLPVAAAAAAATAGCGPLPLLPPALSGDGSTVVPAAESGPATEPEPVETPGPRGAEDVNVFSIGVGDCLDAYTGEGDEGISDVPLIDCSEPHDYEVYYSGDLEGGEYPGQERVNELADEMCLGQFESFVGLPYLESQLNYTSLFPTEDGWTRAYDREVLCLVYDSGKATGTLEGAWR
ncbi:septum formation family protein [Nocardiopsis sp. CNT312]|uniref:septum formation family protein n=1 Tax=Nocardiopsis sp. CNT312 TaxID=1137268 RepID=UPI00048A86C0|nr:septum formation family protein [Nocardiopsis sp. CNT312]